TLAARAYTYIRAGKHENALYPMFLGYPYLIRGYESSGLRSNVGGLNLQKLMGSRVAVFNFEIRIPFTGPEKLTLFKSNMLFSDLNFFFDGGLAWDSNTTVKFKKNIEQIGWQTIDNEGNQVPVYEDIHIPVYSAGISLRVNIFGAMI